MTAVIDRLRGLSAAALGEFLATGVGAAPLAEDIRDIRGARYLLPDWVLPALIAGAVVLGLSLYSLWRWRRRRRAPVLLPYELALQRLDEIRSLMRPAQAREFCIAISDVIRGYIEQRFHVTATRQTTEEFLHDLLQSANAPLAQHQAPLGEFLHQCDFVKFAALSLTLSNMEALRQSARAFVLETAKAEQAAAAEQTHDSVPAT
ncbi:MAG TPA: DUF4381 family protein [Steroidobacteraceae bacterium]|nr:DUF4381 family protein [Steroidobacteraceae bacterium]